MDTNTKEKLLARLNLLESRKKEYPVVDAPFACGYLTALQSEIDFLKTLVPPLVQFQKNQKVRVKTSFPFYMFTAEKGMTGEIISIDEGKAIVRLDERYPMLDRCNNCVEWNCWSEETGTSVLEALNRDLEPI